MDNLFLVRFREGPREDGYFKGEFVGSDNTVHYTTQRSGGPHDKIVVSKNDKSMVASVDSTSRFVEVNGTVRAFLLPKRDGGRYTSDIPSLSFRTE